MNHRMSLHVSGVSCSQMSRVRPLLMRAKNYFTFNETCGVRSLSNQTLPSSQRVRYFREGPCMFTALHCQPALGERACRRSPGHCAPPRLCHKT